MQLAKITLAKRSQNPTLAPQANFRHWLNNLQFGIVLLLALFSVNVSSYAQKAAPGNTGIVAPVGSTSATQIGTGTEPEPETVQAALNIAVSRSPNPMIAGRPY